MAGLIGPATGTDAAKLWISSLAIPALAGQIREHRQADLETRTGRVMAQFYCSQILAAAPDYISPLHEQAKGEAACLLDELR